ncbi:hypothetical protein D6851_02405 [Altericroceibacterium spongiae]|uniref:Uncharacterized protein n=1 Tax=Altericroceibacterium spongiae TaxID=2320269 RepID=A0A420ERU2_9SPHN|nr:hypothetical protein [Altericroceibacterium spongiae]RKF23343.1 hypothetical protein D6851_02405 [Altericroceibacterium spongiae]
MTRPASRPIPKTDLTPYGMGREWGRHRGPYARLTSEEAMEKHGFDLDSTEAEEFIAGAESVWSDGLEDDER